MTFGSFIDDDDFYNIPVSRFEFERIVFAISSPLANQPDESKSERARDQWLTTVTPPVNLSFSFLSHVSRHYIDLTATDS